MNLEVCQKLHDALLPVAKAAGEKIMEIYDRNLAPDIKTDGSPVTQADIAAEAVILEALNRLAPDIPVVSEENKQSHDFAPAEVFFLIDPLDGTREFIRHDGRGEFTVNIALIENGLPVLGIVFAPALDRMFSGIVGKGAWENGKSISTRQIPAQGATVLTSLSHPDSGVAKWLDDNQHNEICKAGSSLKFGMLARGDADIYPRFGPTMEWDTAAGHAVLQAAGGCITNPDGSPFSYGKPRYRNTPFIANGWV